MTRDDDDFPHHEDLPGDPREYLKQIADQSAKASAELEHIRNITVAGEALFEMIGIVAGVLDGVCRSGRTVADHAEQLVKDAAAEMQDIIEQYKDSSVSMTRDFDDDEPEHDDILDTTPSFLKDDLIDSSAHGLLDSGETKKTPENEERTTGVWKLDREEWIALYQQVRELVNQLKDEPKFLDAREKETLTRARKEFLETLKQTGLYVSQSRGKAEE